MTVTKRAARDAKAIIEVAMNQAVDQLEYNVLGRVYTYLANGTLNNPGWSTADVEWYYVRLEVNAAQRAWLGSPVG